MSILKPLSTLFIIGLMTSLSACAVFQPQKTSAPTSAPTSTSTEIITPVEVAEENKSIAEGSVKIAPAEPQRMLELLQFCEVYSNLTAEAQKQAWLDANQVLATNKNDLLSRIKVAVMLTLPTSRLRDSAKAQSHLQALLQENNMGAPETNLIGLLYEFTLDHNKQSLKLRDDAKKPESSQQKIDALTQKNEVLQLKLDAAEQKLNGLKNIEKNMNGREIKK